MTIQNNPTRNQYTATGGQTVFNYNFEIIATGDISVFKGDTRLAISTDYTLTGVGNESGGTVTLVVGATTGDIITIYRSTAQERLTDYQNSGDFLSDEVNADFDRIWAVIQEIDGGQGRYLQLSNTTTASLPVTLDDPIASQILRWKDDSSGVESVSLSTISPGSSVATDFCIYKTNYNAVRSIDVSEVVDGQTLTVTDEGIGGQGVLRNVVGHGVTDNGVTIIVIDANWYWERIIKLITSTLLSDANATLTAGQMIKGECTISPTLERVKTIDTAFNIISAMGGSADNISFDFTFINSSSSKVTIAPNSGVNLVGSMSVIKGAATFRVRRLSPTSVSVTRLETGVLTSIDDLGIAPSPVVNIDSITSTGFITTSAASMGTFPSGSPKVGVLTSIARTSTFVSQTLHDFIPDQIFTRRITAGTPAAWKRLDEPSPTKAWVLFNGVGTVSILGSSNISSITDRGVGLYTINLSTPMPNTNYAVSGYASRGGVGASVVVMGDTSVTRTTSAIPIQVRGFNNAAFDAGEISLVVTGD